jgi:hypothetical protein
MGLYSYIFVFQTISTICIAVLILEILSTAKYVSELIMEIHTHLSPAWSHSLFTHSSQSII